MFNICDFDAVGDGKTLCSPMLQAAIDACAESGGGTVFVPRGVYKIGTIWLRSNVELFLERGSVLFASENLDDYNDEDAYPQNFSCADEQWRGKHLIIAHECENVAICGGGTIDGNGYAYYGEIEPLNKYCWMDGIRWARDKEKLRPGQLLCFIECKNIKLSGFYIKDSTCWSCFLHGCENAHIDGITINNPSTFANSDGIDIDSSRNVTVSNCIIQCGDDCITFRCHQTRLKNKDICCEYVTVSNCVLSSASSVFRVGVGFGTIRHIRVSNVTVSRGSCLFSFNTSYAGRGAANISDVNFSNISASDICYPTDFSGENGHIKSCTFSDIRVYACSNINLITEGTCKVCDILFKNFEFHLQTRSDMLTESKNGAYMIVADNIDNLIFEDFKIICTSEEAARYAGIIKQSNTSISGEALLCEK